VSTKNPFSKHSTDADTYTYTQHSYKDSVHVHTLLTCVVAGLREEWNVATTIKSACEVRAKLSKLRVHVLHYVPVIN
jgi:hypothetical protein